MQVGMTKDQGLYNKPSAAVHPGALAAGTLPQYNTMKIYGASNTHKVRRKIDNTIKKSSDLFTSFVIKGNK